MHWFEMMKRLNSLSWVFMFIDFSNANTRDKIDILLLVRMLFYFNRNCYVYNLYNHHWTFWSYHHVIQLCYFSWFPFILSKHELLFIICTHYGFLFSLLVMFVLIIDLVPVANVKRALVYDDEKD